MVDLWQAIVLLAAGWLLALGAGYVQRWWSKSDTLETEERQATRRLQEEEREALRKAEEEERQARREHRRDRIKPILDFLGMAKQYSAHEETIKGYEEAWERNVGGIKDRLSLEALREAMKRDPRLAGPRFDQLQRAFMVAYATAPTTETRSHVTKVLVHGRHADTGREEEAKHLAAIGILEQLIEDYVTGLPPFFGPIIMTVPPGPSAL